jgi:hypothetical protein
MGAIAHHLPSRISMNPVVLTPVTEAEHTRSAQLWPMVSKKSGGEL